MNRTNGNNGNNQNNNNNSAYWAGGTLVAGAVALAGGIYWLFQGQSSNTDAAVPSSQPRNEQVRSANNRRTVEQSQASSSSSVSSYLSNLLNRISFSSW